MSELLSSAPCHVALVKGFDKENGSRWSFRGLSLNIKSSGNSALKV